MSANTNPIFVSEPLSNCISITSDLFIGGAIVIEGGGSGARIDKILAYSNDPVDSHIVAISLNDSPIATVSVPALSGSGSLPATSLIPAWLGNEDGTLTIAANDQLSANSLVALPDGIAISILSLGGHY